MATTEVGMVRWAMGEGEEILEEGKVERIYLIILLLFYYIKRGNTHRSWWPLGQTHATHLASDLRYAERTS